MREQKNFLSNKILSNQLKKALFLAFCEAKNYGTKTINSKLLLYTLLKANGSLITKNFNNVYKSKSVSNNKINKILNKCEFEFKSNNKNVSKSDELKLNFTKPVRRLLFLIIRSLKGKEVKVVTTFHVFNYLIRNKLLKKWLKECLVEP